MANSLFVLFLLSCLPQSLSAQVLQGQWTLDAQLRIHEHRKGNVRVIVMGTDGVAAGNVPVFIEQTRHDFPLGFIAHQPEEIKSAGHGNEDTPVMRVFNAVALDPFTAWAAAQPTRDTDETDAIAALADAALAQGLRVRYGGVVSADAGYLPEWAAALPGGDHAVADVVETRIRRALALAPKVESFDLFTHALGGGSLSRKIGRPGLRRLFHLAYTLTPPGTPGNPGHPANPAHPPQICVRVEDALIEQRVPDMLKRIRAMREAFVPFDALALEQRAGGIIPQAQVERTFRLLDAFDLPILLASLEVGGASESSAAVNLETFLRLAFASPPVAGIYLSGLHEEDTADPTAALLRDDGTPTEAGQLLDDLFRGLWWTDDEFTTDELGNVTARVFAGNHRIVAMLPDGTRLETLVHVPKQALDDLPMIVLLEP